jgi:hypothetical protein
MQALDSLIDWKNVFAKPAAIMEALAGAVQNMSRAEINESLPATSMFWLCLHHAGRLKA